MENQAEEAYSSGLYHGYWGDDMSEYASSYQLFWDMFTRGYHEGRGRRFNGWASPYEPK